MSAGLQYVWEYRSPSKTVQPHYICKLCSLSCVQHDITDHVKGWKHCFKYMVGTRVGQYWITNKLNTHNFLRFTQKKYHPDKITFEEEEVVKDPSLKGPLRVAAAEVEKLEGRGLIRVSDGPLMGHGLIAMPVVQIKQGLSLTLIIFFSRLNIQHQ